MWYIYKITNKINGKTYIGQHRYEKLEDNYMGSGKHLLNAMKKYGKENFEKEILVSDIKTRAEADIAERNYIKKARSEGKAEYNIVDGGEGFPGGHHTEEAKKKIGQALIGNQHAKGKNIGNTNALGNHLSEKTRQKMGQSRQGNTNNGIALIRCIETNKILRTREWIKEGFTNAYAVAKGYQKSCKGYHFEYVN